MNKKEKGKSARSGKSPNSKKIITASQSKRSPRSSKEAAPVIGKVKFKETAESILVQRPSELESKNDEEDEDDIFFGAKTKSSDNLELQLPDIDYENDPIAELNLVTDLAVHRASVFLDHSAGAREDYAWKMQTFHRFALLSTQRHNDLMEKTKEAEKKTKRTIAHTNQLLGKDESVEGTSNSDAENLEVLPDWSAETAHQRILNVIRENTVPKKKKKQKKRKKKIRKTGVLTPLPDVITAEEAFLNYQITVTEEKLKEHLFVQMAEEKGWSSLDGQIGDIEKRFETEMQACKAEYSENATELRSVEEKWRTIVHGLENEIRKIDSDIITTSAALEEKVAQKKYEIKFLGREIDLWERFRLGEMVRNAAKIQSLENHINHVEKTHRNYLTLTDSEVVISEQQAKMDEKAALDEICDHHVNVIRDTLPAEELQEIENNTTLAAELKALHYIFETMTKETNEMQHKLTHQVSGAQILLETINSTINANIVKQNLFSEWGDLWTKAGATGCLNAEELYDNFHGSEELVKHSGGLTVVGVSLTKRKPFTYLTQKSALTMSNTQQFSASNLKPGFSLGVPEIEVSENALMDNDPAKAASKLTTELNAEFNKHNHHKSKIHGGLYE